MTDGVLVVDGQEERERHQGDADEDCEDWCCAFHVSVFRTAVSIGPTRLRECADRQARDVALIDIHDPRIERDIGDRDGLTPHFVVTEDRWEAGKTIGVLFWPDPDRPEVTTETRLAWLAKAFASPDAAADFLRERFGPPGGCAQGPDPEACT